MFEGLGGLEKVLGRENLNFRFLSNSSSRPPLGSQQMQTLEYTRGLY